MSRNAMRFLSRFRRTKDRCIANRIEELITLRIRKCRLSAAHEAWMKDAKLGRIPEWPPWSNIEPVIGVRKVDCLQQIELCRIAQAGDIVRWPVRRLDQKLPGKEPGGLLARAICDGHRRMAFQFTYRDDKAWARLGTRTSRQIHRKPTPQQVTRCRIWEPRAHTRTGVA